jgi:SAM-dependent methyltransferase
MFLDHYIQWRVNRVNFIEKLYGKSFFRDKTILELGCGHGHIGRYLQNQLGAKVTFSDGRLGHLDVLRGVMPSAETICIDQNNPWDLERTFDIVIHWGVLYHLDNWRQDLACAAKHTNLLFLESEVCDSEDPEFEIKVDQVDGYDQDLGKFSTRPSAAAIEEQIIENGFLYNRFDNKELNHDFHCYDWEPLTTNLFTKGHRRFWICEKL